MKYNIIGDIHSRSCWVDCIKSNSINVFVGDYFCPYHSIPWEIQQKIFLDIVQYKKEHLETILLVGNHDAGHVYWNEHASRFNFEHVADIKKLFLENESLFQAAYSINNKFLVTHAGVSATWLYSATKYDNHHTKYKYIDLAEDGLSLNDSLDKYINKYYQNKPFDKKDCLIKYNHSYYYFDNNDNCIKYDVSSDIVSNLVNDLWNNHKEYFSFDANATYYDSYGTSPTHSPMWIRIGNTHEGLYCNNIFEGTNYVQIFGHTLTDHIEEINQKDQNGNIIGKLINVDCLEYKNSSYEIEI